MPKNSKNFMCDLFGWKIEKYPGPTEYYMLQTVPVDDKDDAYSTGRKRWAFSEKGCYNAGVKLSQ